jgi:hypothetical protein
VERKCIEQLISGRRTRVCVGDRVRLAPDVYGWLEVLDVGPGIPSGQVSITLARPDGSMFETDSGAIAAVDKVSP